MPDDLQELLKHCHGIKVGYAKHEDSAPIELQITFKVTTHASVGLKQDAEYLIEQFLINVKEQGNE